MMVSTEAYLQAGGITDYKYILMLTELKPPGTTSIVLKTHLLLD
jgi:hypothetical protein